MALLPIFFLLADPLGKPGAFVIGEPACLLRAICQIEQDAHTQDYGWDAFEQKNPLPAMQPAYPVKILHDCAREGIGDDPRDGIGRHEAGYRTSSFSCRKPI